MHTMIKPCIQMSKFSMENVLEYVLAKAFGQAPKRESCKIVQRKEESSSRNKWFFSQKVKESINISYGSAAVLLFRP